MGLFYVQISPVRSVLLSDHSGKQQEPNVSDILRRNTFSASDAHKRLAFCT